MITMVCGDVFAHVEGIDDDSDIVVVLVITVRFDRSIEYSRGI